MKLNTTGKAATLALSVGFLTACGEEPNLPAIDHDASTPAATAVLTVNVDNDAVDITVAETNSVGNCLRIARNAANTPYAASSATCLNEQGDVVAEFGCKSDTDDSDVESITCKRVGTVPSTFKISQ